MSQAEFEAELDSLAPAKTPKRKPSAKKKPPLPADDRPATRIVHHLTSVLGLTDDQAKQSLALALLKNGVGEFLLPPSNIKPLRAWIDGLIENVSDTVVFSVTRKL